MSLFTEEEMRLVTEIDSTSFKFDDVCGMEEAKRCLSLPLSYEAHPNHFKSAGFLLFGVSNGNKFILFISSSVF